MACTCSRQNSLLSATMVKPRYCSPRPNPLSNSSAFFCSPGLVSGVERSSVLPKSAAAARTRSRSSRVSGTILKWAVLGRLSFLTVGTSAAVVATVESPGGAEARVVRLTAGGLRARPPEGGNRKDYRIELLKIPQLGEVKANRRRPEQAARLHSLDEPFQAPIHCWLGLGPGVQQ